MIAVCDDLGLGLTRLVQDQSIADSTRLVPFKVPQADLIFFLIFNNGPCLERPSKKHCNAIIVQCLKQWYRYLYCIIILRSTYYRFTTTHILLKISLAITIPMTTTPNKNKRHSIADELNASFLSDPNSLSADSPVLPLAIPRP